MEKLERIDDGGDYFVSVERDSIHSRHSSMVGLQRYRNHHEQMDLSETGFQVSFVSIMYTLHMLSYWCLPGNQGAKA